MADAREREKRGDLPGAIQEYQKAADAEPTNPAPYQALAAIFRRADYLDRETEALTAALGRNRRDVESALRLTDIYIRLVWFDQADRALSLAKAIAPDDRRIPARRGTLCYLAGKLPEMERAALRGLVLAPNDPAFLMMRSEAERIQKRDADAEKTLRQVIAATTDKESVRRAWAALAHLLLTPHQGTPRFADAETAARSALTIAPNDTEAHYWLAKALQGQNRTEEAIIHYEITAKSDPTFEAVTLQLGQLYQRAPGPARRALGKKMVTEEYPAMEANGRLFARAREDVRKRFGDPNAHREVARWYLKTGRDPEAILELRQALRLRPGDAPTRRLLADALRRAGRETEANASL